MSAHRLWNLQINYAKFTYDALDDGNEFPFYAMRLKVTLNGYKRSSFLSFF